MAKFRKIVAVTLVMVFTFVSLGTMDVLANTPGEAEPAKVAPAKIAKLKAIPGYLSVTLKWKRVNNADGYVIYRKVKGKYKEVKKVGKKRNEYRVKKLKKYEKQAFKVTAFVKDPTAPNGRLESPGTVVKSEPVREMTYKLTVKVSTSIRPKGGEGKYLRIRSGQTVEASRFTAGRYVVIKYGHFYYVPKTYVRRASGVYRTDWNYSKTSAENFVNQQKIGSRTRYLMWVNTYTQHTYMFKGKKGKWKCIDHWECATGQASSPTPTGLSGNKQIWKKIRSRHGLSWWSPFSSYNSFHGMRGGWRTGRPASNGCVRTPTEKSRKVYEKARIGTKVLVL